MRQDATANPDSPKAARPSASVRNWMTAARLPFSSVAVAPFLAGGFIAWRSGREVEPLLAGAGALAVMLITSGCHLLGECYDQVEDRLTRIHGRTAFSGGTLVVADGAIAPGAARAAGAILFLAALGLGLGLSMARADWRLAALGALGIASAALYSLPPVRLVRCGAGELLIAFCYGWLTLTSGYLTAPGALPEFSWFFAMPQALAIFMVILLNEFPDREPDRIAGKRNLVVRLGPGRAARLYGLAALLLAAAMFAVWVVFRRAALLWLPAALPAAMLAGALGWEVALRGVWRSAASVEPHCRRGIVLNHLVTLGLAALVTA